MPIANTVRMPLTLEPHVHAIQAPVTTSQHHHSGVNSLPEFQYASGELKVVDLPVSQFAKSDVGIHRQRHEEDECCIKKNET